MNLEQLPAWKSAHNPRTFNLPPIQLPLFPKQALREQYRVSSEQINRIMVKVSARGLCGGSRVLDAIFRLPVDKTNPT